VKFAIKTDKIYWFK